MQKFTDIDAGQEFDWGKTSKDYAAFRPGPPPSFYDRLKAFAIGHPGQRILDIGTGTGVIIRELAKRGVVGSGADITENQILAARQLAKEEKLDIDFKVGPAEAIPFGDHAFDVVIASQCWWYFDTLKALPEIRRVLLANGYLVVTHFNFMPRLDPLAKASEHLILKYNPRWTGADWHGKVPTMPEWVEDDMMLQGMFAYDEPIPFTREAWKGRIRACRGVAASLSPEVIEKFDREHDALIRDMAGESFTVLHRVDAHILQFASCTS